MAWRSYPPKLLHTRNRTTNLKGNGLLDGTLGGQEMKESQYTGEYNSSWARAYIQSGAVGKDVYIYLIANVSSYTTDQVEIGLTDQKLTGITKREELESIIYQYNTHIKEGRTSFLMSGHGGATGLISPQLYHIKDDGQIVASYGGGDFSLTPSPIILERNEAKIIFHISQGTNKKGELEVTGFRIFNYPKNANLFWKYPLQTSMENYETIVNCDAAGGKKGSEYYFNSDLEPLTGKSDFIFFMPETLVKNSQKISTTTTAVVGFPLRELRNADGSWANAPEEATYVEVYGIFKGKSDQLDKEVTANVTYRVHLGFMRTLPNETSYLVNDYFIMRNYEYTYNMTVNGIDNIALEVTTNDLGKWHAEADGEILTEEVITLSADSKLTVHSNETFTITEPADEIVSWLKINGTPADEWADTGHEAGVSVITANPNDTGIERTVVITATRTHFESSITRRITIKQPA